MDMPDSLDRLRDADPLAFLEIPDGPPPGLLGDIVATPRARARRRSPRIAIAVAGVAAAAAIVAVAAPSSHLSLAQRAYAATAPDDDVVYTVSTVTDANHHEVTHSEQWQRGDRMRNVITVTENGKTYRYEHDQRGTSFRTLYDGRVDTIDQSEAKDWSGFAQNVETVVDRFRKAITTATDAGETTFNGRPAHAYTADDVTYYVDPQTALPLGSEMTYERIDAVTAGPRTARPPSGDPAVAGHIIESVDHFERMPATPANLALLDAPDIDAADS
jgi:hypothetical protein